VHFFQEVPAKPAFLFYVANNEDELTVLRAATISNNRLWGISFMVLKDDEKFLASHYSSHFLQFSIVPIYFRRPSED
jgi:hypothetical protein